MKLVFFGLALILIFNTAVAKNMCLAYLSKSDSIQQKLNTIFENEDIYILNTYAEIAKTLDSLHKKIVIDEDNIFLLETYWQISRKLERRNRLVAEQQFDVAYKLVRAAGRSDENLIRLYLANTDIKDHETALSLARLLLGNEPSNLDYLILEIQALVRLRNLNAAIASSDKALQIYPENYIISDLLAYSLVEMAQSFKSKKLMQDKKQLLSRAIVTLKFILKTEFATQKHYFYLTDALHSLGDYEDVLAVLDFAPDHLELNQTQVLIRSVRAYWNLGDTDRAEKMLDILLTKYPDTAYIKNLKF